MPSCLYIRLMIHILGQETSNLHDQCELFFDIMQFHCNELPPYGLCCLRSYPLFLPYWLWIILCLIDCTIEFNQVSPTLASRHIRFVVNSVLQKLLTNMRNKPYKDNKYAMHLWCYQQSHSNYVIYKLVLSTQWCFTM